MSDAKGDQREPSMEEILASIRRIIAEDGDPARAPKRAEEDILELTDVVGEDGKVVPLSAKTAVAEPAPLPEPLAAVEPEPEPEPEPLPEEEPPPVAAEPEPDRLISDAAAAASAASLSELLGRAQREGEGMRLGAVGRTLEDLVRELLRPLLKTWLDENLPQIIERLVQEEISRLVADAQRR